MKKPNMAALAILTAEQYNSKTWEKSGHGEFLKFCKSEVAAGRHGSEGSAQRDVKRALYELSWQAMRGTVKVDQAASTISDVIDLHRSLSSLVADVFSIIDTEMTVMEEEGQRDRFMGLLQACMTFIDEAILKQRLDPDTLENVGLLDSKQSFQSKYVKIKTKLYYKQQKFNLLREENEGYAKLVTELSQDFSEALTYDRVLENVRSLIGCFNLDPNRVLDIILEAFECRPALASIFVPVLRHYMNDYTRLCHVLGFKFHFYQQIQDNDTPTSLYQVAALLLHHGLIDLATLYAHLSPSDTDIVESNKREALEAREYARKLSIVVLSSDKKDEQKEKDKEEKDNKLYQQNQGGNQKLGLCEALLTIGDWHHAQKVLDRLPDFFAASHPPVASAICALVHAAIEPLYLVHSGLPAAVLKRRPRPAASDAVALATVTSWEQLPRAFSMLRYLGPDLSCDTILMGKLLRLGRAFMATRAEMEMPGQQIEDVFRGLLTLMDETIFPSLSLLPGNCCMAEDIWSFLKFFPYEFRYRLYGQWKNDTYASHPKLVRARADCIERAKYVMKRLAKENVKPLGRQIGKLSHNNPAVLFEYVLSQIQKYDNFIGPVVDSFKFLTSLAYDVLAYCIIEALANPDRQRLKTDDTNISLWLQSLASFSGAIFKKYPIDLAGLIQYVINQLKDGKSFDLLILREVVQKMAGIEVSEEITDDQLEAMGGGDLLKVEGGCFAQVRNTKKSSSRLKEALLDHDLAIPLCILMAQERSTIVFGAGSGSEDQRHLKLVGKLFDQCQDTFVQFTSFLSTSLTLEEFCKRLPPIDRLMTTYHVAPETAFLLSRTMYSNNINVKYEELRKADKKDKVSGTTNIKVQRYIEATDRVMAPVVELIRQVLPLDIWDDLSPQFYTTFWTLTMYDLSVPNGSYEKQAQQLRLQLSAIDENKEMAPTKRKKEKERCSALIDKLADEEKRQQEHVNRVLARLKHSKDNWFPARSTKNMSVTAFLQHCVFPRCCFSAIDAVFCAKFIHTLHNLKTPNFSSLICYDRTFSDVTFSVTSCTENEAHRYGRFLCTALDSIMRWHSDKTLYEKECASYPGFVTVFRAKGTNPGNNKADHLDYENYRHVCHKWHFSLTKAMVACLESGNYIQIRNALIVLTRILPHYPRIVKFGSALERRVEKLRLDEKDKRPDIYALAMGYCGLLKARKRTWIQELEFHLKDKETQPKSSSRVNGTATMKTESGTESKPASVSHAGHSSAKKPETENLANGKETKEKKLDVKVSVSRSEQKDNRTEVKSSVKMSNNTVDIKTERKEAAEPRPSTSKDRVPSRKSHSVEKEIKDKSTAEKADKEKITMKEKKEDREKGHKENRIPKEDKEKRREEKERKEKDRLEKQVREEKEREKTGHREEKEREKAAYREEKEREKAALREVKEREKAAQREEKERLKEEKAAARAEKEHKSHKEKKDKIKVKEERADIDQEREPSVGSSTSQHSHRRSAESSPKHQDEKEAKRRKIEGASSSVKDSYYGSDGREKSRQSSPGYDRPGSSADWEWERERDRERDRDWHSDRDRKRHSGAYMDDKDAIEPTKRVREDFASQEPSTSKSSSRVANGDTEKGRSSDKCGVKSPRKLRVRDHEEPEFGMAELAVKSRKESPTSRDRPEKKHTKKSKK